MATGNSQSRMSFVGKGRHTACLWLIWCGWGLCCLAMAGCQPVVKKSRGALATARPVHNVKDFGATANGKTLDTKSIQRAIDQAAAEGGGCVYFPPGNYLTGTIRLRDNLTIYLENGARVLGSTDLQDYDATHPHLIYARDVHNLVISGQGQIDGNGPSFWDGGRLEKWLKQEIDLPRPKDMIRFEMCTNIRLENVQVNYGAFWNIGFEQCSQIFIHGLSMRNGVYENDGPNTDGINLWNCQSVRISDCDIVTGDDCIVVLGESRDVTITNCRLQTSETALMISGVRNLVCSNCTIHDSGCGIGFRVWNEIEVDGVSIDNVVMDVTSKFKGGGTAIYVWSYPLYVESAVPPETALPPPGVLKNVSISNVIASANGLVCVNGAENGYVQDLSLRNIRFTMFGGKVSEFNEHPPYPYPIYGFHHASPYGMFFRHVDGLRLHDIRVTWNTPEQADWGTALRCWQVRNVDIRGFSGRQSQGSARPAVELRDVNNAWIHECQALPGTETFLQLSGAAQEISVTGNDFHHAARAVDNRSRGGSSILYMDHNRQ